MRWEVIIEVGYLEASRVFDTSQEAVSFAEAASQLKKDGEFVEITCRPFAEEGEF